MSSSQNKVKSSSQAVSETTNPTGSKIGNTTLGNNQSTKPFRLVAPYEPKGDQPKVIAEIASSIQSGDREQTIMGVTGCGKTFIMASLIHQLQRPALIIAHNKTLAAQLAEEFKRFFPDNAVHYFVSYYDYYQPESYVPKTDTFIEKQTQINEEIERLRNASTQALLTRRDTIIVASVSCIYGLGNPADYLALKIELEVGQSYKLNNLTRRLADMQFNRTPLDLKRGMFRVRGELLEIYPTSEENVGIRVIFWGDEVERIESFNVLTNQAIESLTRYIVFPAKQYVTTFEKIHRAIKEIESDMHLRVAELEKANNLLAAQRLRQRTLNDVEMLMQLGFCSGIENYSCYFDGRADGEAPSTLLDYFPADTLTFIDESHITLPQIGAMYAGDRSRKETLVEYGFRLPSALNNRPLKRPEFFEKVNQMTYVSATPGDFEQGYGKFE